MVRRLLAILCLLITVISSLLFAADPVPDKVWVLAIGVSRYTWNFSALRGASQAARDVSRALYDAMPDVTEAYVLTADAHEAMNQPTKDNVAEWLRRLGRKVKSGDRVVVYFCGHGVEEAGEPYLLLMNVTDTRSREALEIGGIRISWLRDKLNAMRCQERLLWLDACRVEALTASGAGDGTEEDLGQTETMIDAARLQSDPNATSATFFGCRAGERVYHSKDGDPFFTEAQIEGLEGKATDDQGRITLSSLAEYAQARVPSLLREEGVQASQHPDLYPAQRYGDVFAATVQTHLASTGELILVERMRLEDALRELKLQNTDLIDSRTAKRLGELVGAAYVLVGESNEVPGNRLQVNARLVEVATGRQVPRVAGQCTVDPNDFDTFKPALQRLADELLVGMRAAGITTRRNARSTETAALPPPAEVLPAGTRGRAAPGVFVHIPPGTFTMGSPGSEPSRGSDETQHQVTITKGFYMSATEVTQQQYQEVMGENPSKFKSADRPVERVSWLDAVSFCVKLSEREGLLPCYVINDKKVTWNPRGTGYRLPTEAEWEHACRGGSNSPFYTGDCLSTDEANYDGRHPLKGCPKGQDRGGTWPVSFGGKNGFGLYDMHGNVWEWCWDWYHKGYCGESPSTDPTGPSSGSYRVLRGGSWNNNAQFCRSAYRDGFGPGFRNCHFGFRVVRVPGQR